MPHVHGMNGEVSINGAVAGAFNWSLTYTNEPANTTDFASGGEAEFIAGPSNWNGAFEMFKDGANAPVLGSVATMALKESQTSGQTWGGTGIIQAVTPTADINGVVSYSVTFQGTGTLTPPTA